MLTSTAYNLLLGKYFQTNCSFESPYGESQGLVISFSRIEIPTYQETLFYIFELCQQVLLFP